MLILGFAGSLRKSSYNKGLLKAAQKIAPPGCIVEIFDLASLPLYNQDEESQLPQSVAHFKERILAADAILIAVAEYNYSFSGVLKNALDWGSRPYGQNSWDNKPVAIMGASPSPQGTSRAQYHLRQVFVTLNMHAVNKPELMVTSPQEKFDTQGNLTDTKVEQQIAKLLAALIEKGKA